MINHARTLLVNLPGGQPFPNVPGEEIIDPNYKAILLPTYLNQVRAILFGTSPDRAMLNYRARQLMSILHASQYEPYILGFDPRITYLDTHDPTLYQPSTFDPQINVVTATAGSALYFGGNAPVPDIVGQMFTSWLVTISSSNTVTVQRQTPPAAQQILSYTFTSGLSQQLPLLGSPYMFSFSGQPGAVWQVGIYSRPQADIGGLVDGLGALSAATLTSLFGVETNMGWVTFRNLWQSAPATADRLTGLLLAMLYRMEIIRINGKF